MIELILAFQLSTGQIVRASAPQHFETFQACQDATPDFRDHWKKGHDNWTFVGATCRVWTVPGIGAQLGNICCEEAPGTSLELKMH